MYLIIWLYMTNVIKAQNLEVQIALFQLGGGQIMPTGIENSSANPALNSWHK